MQGKKKLGRPIEAGKGEIRFDAGALKAQAISALPPGFDLYQVLREVLQDIAQGNYEFTPAQPARLSMKGQSKHGTDSRNRSAQRKDGSKEAFDQEGNQTTQRRRRTKEDRALDL